MATFYIDKKCFGEVEKPLCVHGALSANAFLYASGVSAIRISNERGYFIVLPYQGHQIWHASFDDIDMQMQSDIDEPVPTKHFLESYGCFMMHSGLCAVGVPSSPEDTHEPHGDLPTAAFSDARITTGEDAGGKYLALSGSYHHYKTFNANYLFTSTYKLYENGTLIHLNVEFENLKNTPMEYAYLCHINFRPIDGAKLICSAPTDAKGLLVHKIVPPTMPESEAKALRGYMDAMQKTPEVHLTVCREKQIYDPEIVSTIYYRGDENGDAHTMQKRPDGYAFYVKHPIEPLSNSVRWIARTPDMDAMGMVLPSTAEHLGHAHAVRKGQMRTLQAGEKMSFDLSFGLLVPVEAERICEKIEKIMR